MRSPFFGTKGEPKFSFTYFREDIVKFFSLFAKNLLKNYESKEKLNIFTKTKTNLLISAFCVNDKYSFRFNPMYKCTCFKHPQQLKSKSSFLEKMVLEADESYILLFKNVYKSVFGGRSRIIMPYFLKHTRRKAKDRSRSQRAASICCSSVTT
jgi:hypothetical protein